MRLDLRRSASLLEEPVGYVPRTLVVVAAFLLILVYFMPLWSLTMFAPQYEQGLRLHIYGYKLVGGNAGNDAREIDNLNHYIGMRSLSAEDFTEFKWIPFAIGAFFLLFLRMAVMGRFYQLLDLLVLYVYFGLFSLASFAWKLYSYGHSLDPTAPIKVKPFMPPLLGYKKIANFEVYSYPAGASYVLTAVAVLLLGAVVLAIWQYRRRARTIARPEVVGIAA